MDTCELEKKMNILVIDLEILRQEVELMRKNVIGIQQALELMSKSVQLAKDQVQKNG